jgi:hypothetical protein
MIKAVALNPLVGQTLKSFMAKVTTQALTEVGDLIDSGRITPVIDRTCPVHAGQRCWKACWGQPLRSSNLLSSATLTRENTDSAVSAGWRLEARWSHLLVPVLSVEHRLHRDSPQLFCQVTGVADRPERRAARRRSVRPTVQGKPGPPATWVQVAPRCR